MTAMNAPVPVTLQVTGVAWDGDPFRRHVTVFLTGGNPTVPDRMSISRPWLYYTPDMVDYAPSTIGIHPVLQYVLRCVMSEVNGQPIINAKVAGGEDPYVRLKISRKYPNDMANAETRLLAFANFLCRLVGRPLMQLPDDASEDEVLELIRTVLSRWLGQLHAEHLAGGRPWEATDLRQAPE